MYQNELYTIANAAELKYLKAKKSPQKYFMSAIMAGFFIVVAVILSNVTSGIFFDNYPEVAKLLGAFLFSIAIVLIVFAGGELFTGNNMTMAMGVYCKRLKWKNAFFVWLYSYIGNFIGTFILSILVVSSGVAYGPMSNYLAEVVPGKLSLSPFELLVRGILCNYLVCLSVFVGTKMKTESGKLIVMFCIIATFVIAGFEHSIANMGTYTIAYFVMDGLPVMELLKSFFFVTIGNIIGGAVLFAWPLTFVSSKPKIN